MMHGFVIGGTHSGSGKTTLTLGLLRALARRGLRVQPFKVGPDYIDTGWHSRVSGVISRNLDAFMLPEDSLRTLFWRQAAKADVAVIEGVMGLFDGLGTDPLACSTAGMARLLDCPVILAVDGKAVSTSAAATVQGFANLVPGIKVAGVFGLLDQPAPVACFRLVINGLYKSLPHHPWQGPLALASMPDAGEPGAGRDGWVLRLVRRWHSA